jgi:hypothetical protein
MRCLFLSNLFFSESLTVFEILYRPSAQNFKLACQPIVTHTKKKALLVFSLHQNQIVLFFQCSALLQYGFEADIKHVKIYKFLFLFSYLK